MQADGIHPTANGAAWLADILYRRIVAARQHPTLKLGI
jgi:lysophospholipase L1-like esterase